jgi:hypothetical protein
VGNPAADDSAIEAEISAACILPGFQGGSPSNTVAGCQAASLSGLDQARAGEGLPPDSLPAGFWGLSYAQQLEILINQERTSRNLPATKSQSAAKDADALAGAQDLTDPPLLASDLVGGVWAERWNTAAAVFAWVYDDGVDDALGNGSSGCAVLSDITCWGHREIILGNWWPDPPPSMGAACVPADLPGNLSPLSCVWES